MSCVCTLTEVPRVSLPETSPTLRWTGKVVDASVFRFYHPTLRRVLPSQDVTFDESVPFYLLFPYRTAPLPLRRSSLLQVDPLPLAEPVKVTVDSGAAEGGASRGAEPGGAQTKGAEPGGAESEGAESGGAEPRAASVGGPAGASPRQSRWREPLSPRQLREWFARRTRLRSSAAGAGGPAAVGTGARGAGATSPGGVGVTAGAGGTGGAGAAGPGGARTRGSRAARAGGVGGAGAGDPGVGGTGAGDLGSGGAAAGGAGAGGAGAGDPGAGGVGAGGAGAGGSRAGDPRAGGTGAGDPRAGGAGAGGTRAGGVGAGGTGAGGAGAGGAGAGDAGAGGAGSGGIGARGAGAGDPRAGGAGAGGAGAGGTGAGGTVQRRLLFVLPPPSSLLPPGSVLLHILSLLSSTGLTSRLLCPPPHQSQPQLQPDFPLPAPSPYVEQTDSLTEHGEPESRPASPVRTIHTGRRVSRPRPPPVLGTHIMALSSILFRAASPTVTRLLATVVTDPSFESTAAPALVAELVDFAATCRLDYAASLVAESESNCPPNVGGECALGTDVFEERREDFLQLLTAFLQGSLHEEIWLRRPPGFTVSFPAGTQLSLWRPVYGLRQAPREWHDTLRTTIAALEFAPSTANTSLFLRTDTSLPSFYILVYVDDLVFSTTDTEALALVKSKLQKRCTCTDMGPSVLRLPILLATVHSSDLGEAPRSPLVLYVDNKAMLALCQEHRLEHRTKHITLRYFLARELLQRGQLRLAYMATRAKTADICTKALQPGDHQRFCTVLGLVPTLPHLLTT
ncbi:unnamed protein product [Closterium sp. NIES-53]